MIALCRKHGIPESEFTAHPDGFRVIFTKDLSTNDRLLAPGLSYMLVKAGAGKGASVGLILLSFVYPFIHTFHTIISGRG